MGEFKRGLQELLREPPQPSLIQQLVPPARPITDPTASYLTPSHFASTAAGEYNKQQQQQQQQCSLRNNPN